MSSHDQTLVANLLLVRIHNIKEGRYRHLLIVPYVHCPNPFKDLQYQMSPVVGGAVHCIHGPSLLKARRMSEPAKGTQNVS